MELKAVLLGGNSTTTGVFYETTWPMGNSQWKVHHSEKVHASRHGNIWRLTHGGPPPGDTPGNTVMAGAPSHWLKKMICPDLKTAAIQWRYTAITGNYGVSFNKVVFSPGARQSFFSTVTQNAGHRSVYLHCVWKSPDVKVL